MIKNYVQFMYEENHTYYLEQEVKHKDPKKIEIPSTDLFVGFRFIYRHVKSIEGKEVHSQKRSLTGWYYIGTKESANVIVTRKGKRIFLRAKDIALSDLS